MTQLASDAFTRANETPLGGNWSTQTSQSGLNLVSNAVADDNTGADSADNYNAVTWPNDQYSQAKITAPGTFIVGDGPGVGLRMSSSANTYYRIIVSRTSQNASNNIEIGKKVAGAYTTLANRTGTFVDGDTLYGEVQGSVIVVKINGVAVGASVSDSAITSGRAGLGHSGEAAGHNATWDDWAGGDFAGAATSLVMPQNALAALVGR